MPHADAGIHNTNLQHATARLTRGGSWKKQRVVAIIPAGPMMPTKVALSMRSVIFPPNQAAHWIGAVGQEVGEAYSSSIASVLAHPDLSQWEFILTFEHDNLPPADGLVKLIESMEQHPELSCIGGLYWTKGPDGVPQIWGDPNDTLNFRPQLPKEGQVVECVGTGMGFNLWRLSMFRDARLRTPWFKTVAGAEGVGTQDLYFWGDARKYGYRCGVDCRVLVGHYDVVNDTVW